MSRIDQATRALGDDLLVGTKAIAGYTGLSQRQIFHLHKMRELPTFKLGALIAARKSEISGRLSAVGPAVSGGAA